ncbi:MAG: S41 family peptidase [Cystobacter sp.]
MRTPEPLSVFLARERARGAGDTEALVEQALHLLEQAYVHLPSARDAGWEPLEQLGALGHRRHGNRLDFYRELLAVFTRLGDRHTRCVLPEPFASSLAFLPFRVGECFEQGARRYLVLGSEDAALEPGALVVSWNGLPVSEVLARHAAWQYGAHPEARHARAVQTLTFRPLNLMPAPEEESVLLECVSPSGRRCEARLAWRVSDFAWFARYFTACPPWREGFRARTVETAHGTFGLIQVASLQGDPETFVADFVRTLEGLPREGLILDLRDCEEGFVQLGEKLLQLFSSRRISPAPFQFRVTPWSQRLVRSCPALGGWAAAMARAGAEGRAFCEGIPLTSEADANALGRRYSGPLVLLTSALTYSTAEMFAAGVQDHHLGRVLGTAARTGGGGASPWPQRTLFQLSRTEAFRPLPDAPQFRLAVRRCARVHARAGLLLEGEGVVPDLIHSPTRGDLLNDDRRLLEAAGSLLRS